MGGAASTSNFKLNSEIFATPLADSKDWMMTWAFRFILGGLRQYEMWKNSPYPGMARRYAETQPPEVQSLFEAWDREMEQDEGRMSGLEEALACRRSVGAFVTTLQMRERVGDCYG